VVGVDPLRFELAPMEEEDWGEEQLSHGRRDGQGRWDVRGGRGGAGGGG
jgi:hypothetical protein